MNPADQHLIQIVDAATADAAQRSGPWLCCRLGCTQCCIGIFSITHLDAARPITCRVFGPPIRSEEAIGVCELNFNGAYEVQILAAELDTAWFPLETALIAEAEAQSGHSGSTTVAWALLQPTERT